MIQLTPLRIPPLPQTPRSMPALLLLLGLLALSSCRSINKSLTHSKETQKSDIELNSVSSQSAVASSTAVSTKTVVEQVKDTIDEAATNIKASATQADLDKGQVTHVETADGTIDLKKDPFTGVITASATTREKKIPVNKTKTTYENTNVVSTASSSAQNTLAIKDKQEDSKESDTKAVVKKPGNTLLKIILSLIGLLGSGAGVWWFIVGRKKKKQQS